MPNRTGTYVAFDGLGQTDPRNQTSDTMQLSKHGMETTILNLN